MCKALYIIWWSWFLKLGVTCKKLMADWVTGCCCNEDSSVAVMYEVMKTEQHGCTNLGQHCCCYKIMKTEYINFRQQCCCYKIMKTEYIKTALLLLQNHEDRTHKLKTVLLLECNKLWTDEASKWEKRKEKKTFSITFRILFPSTGWGGWRSTNRAHIREKIHLSYGYMNHIRGDHEIYIQQSKTSLDHV